MKFASKYGRDALLLLLSALSVFIYVQTANGGFPLDDSWIHQVYGRNLAQTGQWAFVPGVPSAASTSPLYTVLLSIGYRLNIPFKLWTHGLGIVALWVAGMVGARMAERALPKNRYVGWAAGLALVLAWHLIWAAASGMETMLFSMWTLVLLYLAWRECDADASRNTRQEGLRGALFGALAAVATVTRPEGVVLAGLIGLTMLIVRPQGTWRGFMVWAGASVVAFGVVIAPYLVLNLQLTGGILPDTAAAKQAENAPLLEVSYPGRIVNMLFPLIAGGQLLLLPGIIYYALWAGRRVRENKQALLDLLPLVWAVGLIALYAARLPAPYQHGRYVIPALPALIVSGVIGLAAWVKSARGLAGRVVTRAVAISTGLAFAYFAFVAGPGVYRQDVSIIDEEMVASAHWIADNLPTDELLAIHDIGAVGYFAPRPIIDLAGLVSPEIVPFINDEESLWGWMQERGARYLMAFPDQVPGDDISDSRLCPVFTTNGPTSPAAGGPNMTVYALSWDGTCPVR